MEFNTMTAENNKTAHIEFNEAEFESDFAECRDEFGMIQNGVGTTSRNGIRYTSEYYQLKKHYGIHTDSDLLAFQNLIMKSSKKMGLLKASPVDDSQVGMDDYLAAASVSEVIASLILIYWEENNANFNNVQPGKFTFKSWFGRYPSLKAHFIYCRKLTPNFFLRLAWCASLTLTALTAKSNQDEWVLGNLQIISYRNSGFSGSIEEKACKLFVKQFRKNWGETQNMRKCLEKYFGFLHPLAKWAQDV